jgi:sugar lactone lactonase YvrE
MIDCFLVTLPYSPTRRFDGEGMIKVDRDLRVVLDGLVFPEVPRWRDGRLWFCDFQLWLPDATGQVIVIEEDGSARIVVEQVPGGPPTGLGWLPDGRLLLVAAGDHSLLALESDGTLAPHADLSEATSHWCNELAVDASGRAYVGSCEPPPAAPALTEMMVVHPDGRVEVANGSMRYPNGSVITPDGGTLIVAESQGQCLSAFAIATDGTLGEKRLWAEVPGAAPDGISLDREGCVWFADAGGNACVRVAEGGEVKDRIETDQGAFACTLGGDDGRTLFVMTSSFPTGDPADYRPGKIVACGVEVPGTGSP